MVVSVPSSELCGWLETGSGRFSEFPGPMTGHKNGGHIRVRRCRKPQKRPFGASKIEKLFLPKPYQRPLNKGHSVIVLVFYDFQIKNKRNLTVVVFQNYPEVPYIFDT